MLEVEHNTVVYPPNKCLERKIELSTTPVVYDHLLFLDFNGKGESILGSSNLNGTVWEGTLLFFNNEENLQLLKYNRSLIGSTISDGKFLNDNTFALAEDTGVLNILSLSRENAAIESAGYFRDVDRIPKLAVWKNSSRVLTCSKNSVTVWDINSAVRKPVHNFQNYHTELVNCVDTVKTEPNVFASVSMDRKCCLWDDRDASPATVLYNNEFCSLTSVACNQHNTNYIVVGTEGGDIYLLDKREPREFISVASCNCEIYRIVFDDSNRLAVCGDLNKVLVFKCEDEILNSAYCNDKHCGFVRGLAWHNETLYSCGFDKQVVKHLL
ncbi:methylosome protein WDR77-like [Tenebrio molitor]|jgi:WD40 repeat protein|uniref:methylosome protein WDR77-like n=1 Tax=Tenebrio molitor TaxID=7067 RepID=UPI0036246F2E